MISRFRQYHRQRLNTDKHFFYSIEVSIVHCSAVGFPCNIDQLNIDRYKTLVMLDLCILQKRGNIVREGRTRTNASLWCNAMKVLQHSMSITSLYPIANTVLATAKVDYKLSY